MVGWWWWRMDRIGVISREWRMTDDDDCLDDIGKTTPSRRSRCLKRQYFDKVDVAERILWLWGMSHLERPVKQKTYRESIHRLPRPPYRLLTMKIINGFIMRRCCDCKQIRCRSHCSITILLKFTCNWGWGRHFLYSPSCFAQCHLSRWSESAGWGIPWILYLNGHSRIIPVFQRISCSFIS